MQNAKKRLVKFFLGSGVKTVKNEVSDSLEFAKAQQGNMLYSSNLNSTQQSNYGVYNIAKENDKTFAIGQRLGGFFKANVEEGSISKLGGEFANVASNNYASTNYAANATNINFGNNGTFYQRKYYNQNSNLSEDLTAIHTKNSYHTNIIKNEKLIPSIINIASIIKNSQGVIGKEETKQIASQLYGLGLNDEIIKSSPSVLIDQRMFDDVLQKTKSGINSQTFKPVIENVILQVKLGNVSVSSIGAASGSSSSRF